MDLLITVLLIAALFVLLGSGVWIGIALAGVAWIGMQLFSSRPAGDAMAVTIWGSASSWTLTALPLFVWMGEILFRTRLSEDMFKGLAPWLERWSLAVAVILTAAFAYYSVRLAGQSHAYHDISTGNDATPLWIPQLSMAIGNLVLAIAFIDQFVGELTGTRVVPKSDSEPAHVE